MSHNYIAMTIGPILDTINLAPSPAALWTASYMFSSLTKILCQKITDSGVPAENIVSPYYDPDDPLITANNGVGLFHDRIIVCTDGTDFTEEALEKIKKAAIQEVAESFSLNAEYLQEYVMIASVSYANEHAIKGCGTILDCLELAKPFVQEDSNHIFSLFINEGKDQKANEQIKNLPVVKSLGDNWQLLQKNGTIKSLSDIAGGRIPEAYRLKKNTYYAIVRSDGDNMSKIFSALSTNIEIRNYSNACLKYCAAIADLVKEYGGITIYSGGDDLLALMPLEKAYISTCDFPNLFAFLQKANETLQSHFKTLVEEINTKNKGTNNPVVALPTLSFGVTVTYEKFPLYEALQDSQYLLFGVAKQYKNCTALRVQKHAGQSEGLLIPYAALGKIIELKTTLDTGINSTDTDTADQIFLSALHKLSLFDSFFTAAADSEQVQNLFDNLFDADDHTDNTFLKKTLPAYFSGLRECNPAYSIRLLPDYLRSYLQDKGITPDKDNDKGNMAAVYPVPTLVYLLRILKLYYEKAGERFENV